MRPFIDDTFDLIKTQYDEKKKRNRKQKEKEAGEDTITTAAGDEVEDDLTLSETDWDEYIKIKAILQIPFICTLKLQKSDITLVDLFAAWKDVILKLNSPLFKDHQISKDIVSEMGKRSVNVIGNEASLTCAYLHPQVFHLLTPEEKTTATGHIQKIWERLEMLKIPRDQLQPNNASGSGRNGDQTGNTDQHNAVSSFQELLSQTMNAGIVAAASSSRSRSSASGLNLARTLSSYERAIQFQSQCDDGDAGAALPPVPDKFWDLSKNKKQRDIHQYLYEIARIIFSAAPTQVGVERAFSGLAFLLNPLRTKLDADRFEKIMILRQNRDFLDSCGLDALDEDDLLDDDGLNGVEIMP